MRFQEVQAIYQRIEATDKACLRAYTLSERTCVILRIVSYDDEGEGFAPHVRMSLITKTGKTVVAPDGGIAGELAMRSSVEEISNPHRCWDKLTPRELTRLAEIKATVDAWILGSSDALLPSTAPLPDPLPFR